MNRMIIHNLKQKDRPLTRVYSNARMLLLMLSFALPALFGAHLVNAQASAYVFAASSGTYTPITGGTVINASIPDDVTYGPVTLTPGFTFSGTTYTTAYVTTNGLITLGGAAPSNSEYNAIANSTGSGVAICPFNADLNGSTVTGNAQEIRFQTVGNEHIFQWTDAQRYNLGDQISFQARLNTTTGAIRFIYGGSISAGTSLIRQPAIGVRTSPADFKNITVGTGAETWATPLPGVANTDLMRFTTDPPAKIPVAGQIYTFTPPNCQSPANVTATFVTANNATINFTGTGTSYIVEYGPAGFTPGTANAPGTSGTLVTGIGSPITLSGLSANTSYDVYVRTNCSSSGNGYSQNTSKLVVTTTSCAPQTITSSTPATRCGTGTVTLGAAASGGTIRWYTAALGGSSVGTGTSFTTPTINTTTTYFAGAETIAAGSVKLGLGANSGTDVAYDLANGTYGGIKTQYLFTAAELQNAGLSAGNLTGFSVEFTSAGAAMSGFNVEVGAITLTTFSSSTPSIVGSLSPAYSTATFTPVVGVNSIPFTTPFNWNGTSNIIISVSWSNNNSSNASSAIKYDATTNYASQSYRRDNVTPAVIQAFTGSVPVSFEPLNATQNRAAISILGQAVCTGQRTSVTATVTIPPALSVSTAQTVCNSSITPLSVTSPLANYNSYIWSPVANLYTDAAATIPYTGLTASTVYYKSPTAGTVTYTVSANNTTSLCAQVATVDITNLPGSVTVVASPASICGSGTTTLVLTPATGYGTGIIQWQSSANNSTFADIAGANANAYTTPTITSKIYYRAIIKNTAAATCVTSASDTGLVLNPAVVSTTPGSRCGPGTVVLGATATDGTLRWYNVATGGTTIASGTSFTTPGITATTTYYVSTEAIPAGNVTIGTGTSLTSATGFPTAFMNRYTQYWSQMVFTAAELTAAGLTPGAINKMTMTIDALGDAADVTNFTIMMGATAASTLSAFTTTGLSTVYGPATYTSAVGANTMNFSTPYVWDGTSNIIVDIRQNGVDGINNATTYYTTTTGNTVLYAFTSAATPSIYTTATSASTSTSRPNVIFGQTGCFSARTPVIATINPKADTTVTVTGALSFCPGKSVTFNASSATGLTYQWLLNNNIIPSATAASYTATAAGTYRVRVSNGPCSDTSGARTVTVLPAPTATVTVGGPTTFCSTDSVLVSGPAQVAGITYQWLQNGAAIAGATTTSIYAKTSGAYRLALSNGTCTDTSAITTITVNPAPVVAVSPATAAVCSGTSINLTASGAATYSWSPATGLNTTTGATVIATPATTITYTITGTAANGCVSIATKTVTVSPAPTVTVSPATAAVCIGSSTTLTASGAATYSWSPATGLSATTGTSVVASPTVTTTYTIVGDDGIGCTATTTKTVTVNPLPTIAIAPATATTVCEGISTLLTASGGITYSWSPATGLSSTTGTSVLATPTTTTTYTVAGTNISGCQNTATKLITINPAPVINVTPVTSAICAGSSIALTAGGANTYSWTPSATLSASTGATVTATPATTTTYSITGTSISGCSRTVTKTVTVTPIPVVTVTPAGATAICQGSTVSLTASGATTYSWTPGTGLSSTTNATVLAFPAVTTTYTVSGNTNGCIGTATKTITVNPLPAATATATGPTAFCEGGSVIIVANSGTGLTYQWRRGTTVLTGETGSSYTATQSGFYNVIVSNGLCSATSGFVNVTVSTMPVAVITPLGAPTFCRGGSVDLSATTGAGYTYKWQLNGNDIPGATMAIYTAGINGNYTVQITNGTCVATSPVQVVSVAQGPDTTVTVSSALSFCQGGLVALKAHNGIGYTYQWYKNGQAIPGDTSVTTVATTSGDYTVMVSDGTCSGISSIRTVNVHSIPVTAITVTGGNQLSTSGTFLAYQWYRNGFPIVGATAANYTAARDGFYTVVVSDSIGCSATSPVVQISSLDINTLGAAKYDVKVYPNPARDIVRIEAESAVDVKLSTIDGREVMSRLQATSLDITSLADGIYTIRISDHKTGALIKIDKLVKATR